MMLGLGDAWDKAPVLAAMIVLLALLSLTQVHAFKDRNAARKEMTEMAARHKAALDSITSRHENELVSINSRHEAEVRRLQQAHDEVQAEWRATARELRADLDDLGKKLDTERRLRREAEDRAAMAARPMQQARVVLELPTTEAPADGHDG
jgi:uncharacterized protein YukE